MQANLDWYTAKFPPRRSSITLFLNKLHVSRAAKTRELEAHGIVFYSHDNHESVIGTREDEGKLKLKLKAGEEVVVILR